ncbi:MAG: DNA primase [Clostridia bacterium]|nr:DNA primase [Clostridia bacterium]
MALPEGFIEELKIRNNIEDVISAHVTLKRAGSNLVGLCPFHNEKSPSFTVFPATRGFYCFGCGAGGDVITFVMKTENLDYIGAVEFLAKRAGIEMPEDDFRKKEDSGVKKSRVLAMNRDAARFYHAMLSKPEGAAGLVYLRSRGLSDAVIRRFGLGFAPDEFSLHKNLFCDHMHGLGYTDKELVGGFLCSVSQKNGRLYPIFRNRVMFPVIDTQGEVVAFGGRVMDDSKPKYLNSSDTPAFKKSRNLFALNFARSHCAERLILCEGYMDVIAVHAAGIPTAVATLGTAITQEQAHIMARYTKEVVIAYDMDDAGRRAADKAIALLEGVGVKTKILKLDGAKDPDEFIRKKGADAFRLRLDDSENQFDYRCNTVIARHDMDDFNDRMACVSEITALLATLRTDVERDVYIGRLSERLGVSRESLKNDVLRSHRKKENAQKREETRRIVEKTAGVGDRINPDKMKYRSAAAAEETVLGILLLYPERIPGSRQLLCEDDFVTAFGRRVYGFLLACTETHGGFDMGYLGEEFTEGEIGYLAGIQASRAVLTDNGDMVLADAAKRLCEESERIRRRESVATTDDIDEILRRKRAELT